MKPAEVCPDATVTLVGTVRLPLLLESGTANPLEEAAVFRVTVQGVLPGVLIVRFEQFTALTATGWDTEIEPDAPLAVIAEPVMVEATTPVI